MNISKYLYDGQLYTTVEFSKLDKYDLQNKRRNLVCPECLAPAFFRHATSNNRSACFGARPHKSGCSLAALDSPQKDYRLNNQTRTPGYLPQRIIVDFNYGESMYHASDFNEGVTNSNHAQNVTINQGNVHIRATTGHRRLRSLLLALENGDLLANRHLIHIDGFGDTYSDSFFINFQTDMPLHAGQYAGYWGAISDANMDDNGTLWLNIGGYRSDLSICIDLKFRTEVLNRFNIKEAEELAGALILIVGTMRFSANGKPYIELDATNCITIDLTK